MSALNASFVAKLEIFNQKLHEKFVLKDYPPLTEAEFVQSVVGDRFSLAGFEKYLVKRYSLNFFADGSSCDLILKAQAYDQEELLKTHCKLCEANADEACLYASAYQKPQSTKQLIQELILFYFANQEDLLLELATLAYLKQLSFRQDLNGNLDLEERTSNFLSEKSMATLEFDFRRLDLEQYLDKKCPEINDYQKNYLRQSFDRVFLQDLLYSALEFKDFNLSGYIRVERTLEPYKTHSTPWGNGRFFLKVSHSLELLDKEWVPDFNNLDCAFYLDHALIYTCKPRDLGLFYYENRQMHEAETLKKNLKETCEAQQSLINLAATQLYQNQIFRHYLEQKVGLGQKSLKL